MSKLRPPAIHRNCTKEEQLTNLATHHKKISLEISESVLLILNSDTLPLNTLIELGKRQEQLLGSQALLNALGMQLYGGEWVDRAKSKIVSMTGTPLEKVAE